VVQVDVKSEAAGRRGSRRKERRQASDSHRSLQCYSICCGASNDREGRYTTSSAS
jgi:hypothetical protein